jgi:hypothetical protein
MGTIYRVQEENPILHYYNNALDYYTLNKISQTVIKFNELKR